MATHLSARLVWHDNGWDGCVCQNPKGNAYCIVHQHVRENRHDQEEQRSKGVPLQQLTVLPPCSRDTGAFAPRSYRAVHNDPLEFRRLLPVEENVPPYSCCPSPYRWMREENFRNVCEAENLRIRQPDSEKDGGWVMEPDRQKALLRAFWGKLEPGRSLIFYYCKDGHPFENAASRVLIGVGRISELGPQLYFGATPEQMEPYPVWSRRVTQDFPREGVRLPYQEYLRESLPVDGIVCSIPNAVLPDFSFVGGHVTDDSALTVVEQLIHSVQLVRVDGKVAGDWAGRLVWLNDVLAELWQGRGPFPGIGSVLQFLGFQTGTTFQRAVLAPMARKGENAWNYVRAILEGKSPIEPGEHAVGLKKAQEKWKKMPGRQALLSTLVSFELTPAQVQRIADPTARAEAGISATETQLVENPYLICELDRGSSDSDVIGLETIDHGMLPEGDSALFIVEPIESDDPRRVRAIVSAVLKEASAAGDTLLTLADAFARVRSRFPDRPCRPDIEVFGSDHAFHRQRLWLALDHDPPLLALRELQELEAGAAALVRQRAGRPTGKGVKPDWDMALNQHFKVPKTDRESVALEEKRRALETLFTGKLSVLTGGAGTGKTSVLQVFLAELDRVEGQQPLLLLAPTGKARVRLATKTGRNAMTIHQFLLKQDWILPATFALKHAGGRQFAATTVVIDECSMIPADILGTLIKALDLGPLKRLILVGDPNQLPPIGPGRPFVDVIGWLRKEHPECLARLSTCMRVDDSGTSGTLASAALSLAEGYRSDSVHPADDEVLSAIGRIDSIGDLECHFWNDLTDLMAKLRERLTSLLNIATKDYGSFNRSLGGISEKESDYTQSEAWQILCPTRTDLHGTEELNRVIQSEYRGGILKKSRFRSGKFPRPFGDREIVWCDKVIHVRNRRATAWPSSATALNYIANGEIGVVCAANRGQSGDSLDVRFSTQPNVSYRYWRNQVNEDLELAYALTVHKAQGSDFDVVFLIVPQATSAMSRELLYTGLTRFRKRLVLLVEKDLSPLLSLRHPEASATEQRNTHMFTLSLRPEGATTFHPDGLIHRTRRGVPVRSKSEVIVAETLDSLGISWKYEKPLAPPNEPRNFRLPDFTVSYQGDVYYWEHLGMLGVPSYREAWEKKLEWYKACGFYEQLITSEDGPDGGIEVPMIERLARERILGG